jgi:hypothetical protein
MERAVPIMSRVVVVAGAIALLGALFLPWLEQRLVCAQGGILPCDPVRYSGWETFRFADVALALCAAGALSGVVLATALGARWPYLGVALLGWAAVALTIVGVQEPAGAPALGRDVAPRAGYALALLASGAISIGALWAGLTADRTPPASS